MLMQLTAVAIWSHGCCNSPEAGLKLIYVSTSYNIYLLFISVLIKSQAVTPIVMQHEALSHCEFPEPKGGVGGLGHWK